MNSQFSNLRKFTLAATFALASANAGPFSQLIVFGDSLSDTGNAFIGTGMATPPSPPYFLGHFSNGPVWVEWLAGGLGLPLSPFLAGGTNFAVGGARTVPDGSTPDVSIQAQLVVHGTVGTPDPLALYILTGGGNDIRDAAAALTDPLALANAGSAAAQNLLIDAAALVNVLGIQNILLSTVGNVGLTPESAAKGNQAASAIASAAFNTTIRQGVDLLRFANPGANFFFVDQEQVLNSIVQDALLNGGATYGITDATNPCIANQAACNSSLWFDDIHPTTGVHLIYAQSALQAIPEPGTAATVAAAAFAVLFWRTRRHFKIQR